MTLVQPHNVAIDGRPLGLSHYQTYRLSHDWSVYFERNGFLFRFTVKEGYIYDGASVPALAWAISRIRPDGLIRAAATLHDPIYEFEGDLNNKWITCEVWHDGEWSKSLRHWHRKEADGFFKELLERAGYGDKKIWAAHQAVRKGGWIIRKGFFKWERRKF